MSNQSGATAWRLAAALLVAGMGFGGSASATLINRGGGLVYDDVLDITWLQDANYAQTSGFDADGLMTWDNAIAWAAGLSYFDSVRNVTWTDWRLAAINILSPSTTAYNCNSGGAAACAANGNELGYMYYFDLDGVGNNTGNQTSVLGSVTLNNIRLSTWSSTELGTEFDSDGVPISDDVWYFRFPNGTQDGSDKSLERAAWAVRAGDVAAAPEPATLVLVALGLAGLGFSRRKLLKVSP